MTLDAQLSRVISRYQSIKAVVPRQQPGILDVLIAPYWGPIDGRDSHGQYFSPSTNFLHDVIPYPPVFYYHGAETGSGTSIIGSSGERWDDDRGVWQTLTLDMTQPDARSTWNASLSGRAFASTGAVPASIRINPETGEIEQWLVGEISLMVLDENAGVEPANTYAIALPRLKALRDGLSDDGKRLFDQVYIVDEKPEGGLNMEELEKLTNKFAALIEKLSVLLGVSVDDVSSTLADVVEDAGDIASNNDNVTEGGDECTDCEAAADDIIDALDIDAEADDEPTEMRAKSLRQLRNENITLRAKLARSEDEAWIAQHIKAGRVTPSERASVLSALTKARASGPSAKGTVNAIKAMVASRPVTTAQSAKVTAKNFKGAGFHSQNPADGVDQATIDRMRGYAGLKEG